LAPSTGRGSLTAPPMEIGAVWLPPCGEACGPVPAWSPTSGVISIPACFSKSAVGAAVGGFHASVAARPGVARPDCCSVATPKAGPFASLRMIRSRSASGSFALRSAFAVMYQSVNGVDFIGEIT
jgi:hypothetical protein